MHGTLFPLARRVVPSLGRTAVIKLGLAADQESSLGSSLGVRGGAASDLAGIKDSVRVGMSSTVEFASLDNGLN